MYKAANQLKRREMDKVILAELKNLLTQKNTLSGSMEDFKDIRLNVDLSNGNIININNIPLPTEKVVGQAQ